MSTSRSATNGTPWRGHSSASPKARGKQPIEYNVNGTVVKVSPVDEYGIATIWDADILIWAATQITEVLDRGGTPSRKIQFHPYTLLKGIRRGVGGDQYKKLQAGAAAAWPRPTSRPASGRRKAPARRPSGSTGSSSGTP